MFTNMISIYFWLVMQHKEIYTNLEYDSHSLWSLLNSEITWWTVKMKSTITWIHVPSRTIANAAYSHNALIARGDKILLVVGDSKECRRCSHPALAAWKCTAHNTTQPIPQHSQKLQSWGAALCGVDVWPFF